GRDGEVPAPSRHPRAARGTACRQPGRRSVGGTTRMNASRDVDSIIATWLEDGPTELPAETRRAITVGIRTQPRIPRTAFPGGIVMSSFTRLATAAGVILLVGGLSVFLLSNRNNGVGSPAPSAAPSVAPSAAPSSTPAAVVASPSVAASAGSAASASPAVIST